MPDYVASFLMESTDGGTTTKTFSGTFADFATATIARNDLQTDLLAASHARVIKRSLAETEEVAGVTSGAKSVFLRASATVRLNGTSKKGNFMLPAPNDTINPAGSTFDKTAAAWTDLMANFASGLWTVSDGEYISGTEDGTVGYYSSGETNF